MERVIEFKEGDLFEVSFKKTKEIENSDMIGKKFFVVSRYKTWIRESGEKETIPVDIYPFFFRDGKRILKMTQIIFEVEGDQIKRCKANFFGKKKPRKGKGKRIGDNSKPLYLKFKIIT